MVIHVGGFFTKPRQVLQLVVGPGWRFVIAMNMRRYLTHTITQFLKKALLENIGWIILDPSKKL